MMCDLLARFSEVSIILAYWRAAKASLSEKLWQQAIDLSREGLSANPGNKDLEKMLADAEAQLQR